jgi:hypothetical protein
VTNKVMVIRLLWVNQGVWVAEVLLLTDSGFLGFLTYLRLFY